MKKCVTALVLTVFMTVFAGCGGGSKSPVVGDWKMKEIETMGITVSIEEYMESAGAGDMDLNMQISIKDDGTFTGEFAGEQGEGTWEYKEPTLTLKSEGEEMQCEYKDSKLVMSIEEGGQSASAIFEK